MYIRFLSVITLLGTVAAVAVIMLGYQSKISDYFSPSGGLEKDAGSVAKAPVGTANTIAAQTDMEYLLQAVPYETVGTAQLNAADLEQALLAAEPGTGLGKPLEAGGITLEVIGGRIVVLCAQPERAVCVAYDSLSRATSEFEEASNAGAASEKAVLGLSQ